MSKFNYGAFIDPESEESTYEDIDDIIAGLVQKIFKMPGQFDINEWIEFCAAPTKAGGLGLILPGYYFPMMNIVSKTEDVEDGFTRYHKEKDKFEKEYGGGKYDSCIAIHAFKNYYSLLDNDKLDLAFKMLRLHSDFHFKDHRPSEITAT